MAKMVFADFEEVGGGYTPGMLQGYKNKGVANWVRCKCLKIKESRGGSPVYKKVTGDGGLILKSLEGLAGAAKIGVNGRSYVPGDGKSIRKRA